MSIAGAQGRRAISSLLLRHAFAFFINFAGTLLLARALGPSVWGIYSIGYTAQVICGALLERSTVGVLVQRAREPTEKETGALLSIGTLAAFTFGGALWLIVAYWTGTNSQMSLIALAVAASLPGYAARAVPLAFLERTLSYRRVAAVELVETASFNLVAVAGITAGFGFPAVALAAGMRVFPSLAAAWLLARIRPGLALSLNTLRELSKFGVPYAASNSLAWINSAAAPVAIGGLLGLHELGVLQLAYTIVAYPQVLNGILGRVALPMYSRIQSDPIAIVSSVGSATSLSLRYIGGTMMGLGCILPAIAVPLYGDQWGGIAPIALATAPSFAFATSCVFIIAALNATGQARSVLTTGLLFTAIYWASALALVASVGSLGLPLAYSLGSLAFLRYLYAFKRRVGPLSLRPALAEFTSLAFVLLVASVEVSAGHVQAAAAIGTLILLTAFRGLASRLARVRGSE